MAGLADGRAVRTRVDVDDVRAHGHVHGHRHAEYGGLGQQALVVVGKAVGEQGCTHRLADTDAAGGAVADGGVEHLAGFPGGPEGAGPEHVGHLLGGAADHGNLGIMDDARAV